MPYISAPTYDTTSDSNGLIRVHVYYQFGLGIFLPFREIFERLPGSIPREKRSGSSAGVVGALPGRSLGRSAPRGRGLGPQSRAHRLYFQGPFFLPSPDLRREGKSDVCVHFWPAFFNFFFMRDATGKHLHATHTGSDSPNTKHTLEHGVKHIFKDKISSVVFVSLSLRIASRRIRR